MKFFALDLANKSLYIARFISFAQALSSFFLQVQVPVDRDSIWTGGGEGLGIHGNQSCPAAAQ